MMHVASLDVPSSETRASAHAALRATTRSYRAATRALMLRCVGGPGIARSSPHAFEWFRLEAGFAGMCGRCPRRVLPSQARIPLVGAVLVLLATSECAQAQGSSRQAEANSTLPAISH